VDVHHDFQVRRQIPDQLRRPVDITIQSALLF
jgi:hypothetical protein